MQGFAERPVRNNQMYHQGIRGMLQSSSGSGGFNGQPDLGRQLRPERRNIQDSQRSLEETKGSGQDSMWLDQN